MELKGLYIPIILEQKWLNKKESERLRNYEKGDDKNNNTHLMRSSRSTGSIGKHITICNINTPSRLFRPLPISSGLLMLNETVEQPHTTSNSISPLPLRNLPSPSLDLQILNNRLKTLIQNQGMVNSIPLSSNSFQQMLPLKNYGMRTITPNPCEVNFCITPSKSKSFSSSPSPIKASHSVISDLRTPDLFPITFTLDFENLHLGEKNGGYYLNLDKIDKTQFPEEYHELIEYAVLASQKDCFDPMDLAINLTAKSYPTLVEHLHDEWIMTKEYPMSRNMLALSQVYW
jgi:hypothetical protein